MSGYDSDSSGADDVETNVLLGYASKEATSDDFSQLGGHPTWLDGKTAPDGALAKCKICNSLMSLIIQLNADLPDRYPGHERRLYVWTCRRKACRRMDGSVRAIRAVQYLPSSHKASIQPDQPLKCSPAAISQPAASLGETLFGVGSARQTQANPFASPQSSNAQQLNPFAATSSPSLEPVQKTGGTSDLPQTFAEKARLASPRSGPSAPKAYGPQLPWPSQSEFPEPFPAYHVDADKEYLDAEANVVPSNARLDPNALDGEGSSGSAADEKAAFESTMDRTFQRFADRLAQNPEQVLRYEIGGQPLLYSATDAVGRLISAATQNFNKKVQIVSGNNSNGTEVLAKVPRCKNCNSARLFELQLTPHAIIELEQEDMSLDGMDWGTILVAVCSADCKPEMSEDGGVGYVEEWVGVQWEELTEKRR